MQRTDVVEMVIERLMAADKQDLLPITELLASLVFKGNPDSRSSRKGRIRATKMV